MNFSNFIGHTVLNNLQMWTKCTLKQIFKISIHKQNYSKSYTSLKFWLQNILSLWPWGLATLQTTQVLFIFSASYDNVAPTCTINYNNIQLNWQRSIRVARIEITPLPPPPIYKPYHNRTGWKLSTFHRINYDLYVCFCSSKQ